MLHLASSKTVFFGSLLIGAFVLLVASAPLRADQVAEQSQCKKSTDQDCQTTAGEPLVQVISIGILAHDADHLWSGFRREDGIDFNAEVSFRPLFHFDPSIPVYPAVGASINDRGDTSKLYADLRVGFLDDSKDSDDCGDCDVCCDCVCYRFFANVGAGGAIHDGKSDTSQNDRKSLGSPVLFHFSLEFGVQHRRHHRISIFFDHVSNAYLADENEGLDTLGFRYGYRF